MKINPTSDNRATAGSLFRMGIVGLGRQGVEHLRACMKLAGDGILSVTGICDVNPERLAALSRQYGLPGYGEPRMFLESGSLDAVILAVPNDQHAEVTSRALQAGLHVLKEKPLAMSMSDATQMIALASQQQRILRVAQQRAFHPHYQAAKGWVCRSGPLRFLDYTFCLNDTRASWYWRKTNGGGCWHGLGWHGCWTFSFLGLAPDEVCVHQITGKRPSSACDTDDSCFFTSLSTSGAFARMFLSVVHPAKREELFVEAEQGAMRLSRSGLLFYDGKGTPVAECAECKDWDGAYEAQIECFLADIRNQSNPFDPLSWRTMQLHSAALASADNSGRPVSVPRYLPLHLTHEHTLAIPA